MKSKSPFLSKSPLKIVAGEMRGNVDTSLMGSYNSNRMGQNLGGGSGLPSGGGSSADFDRTRGRGTGSGGGGGMPTNMDLGNMSMQGDPGGGTSTVSQDYNSNMRNQYGGGGSNEIINNMLTSSGPVPGEQVIYGASAGADPDGGGGAGGGGQSINMAFDGPEGTIDTAGRGTTRPDTTQERIDQQLRASNAEMLAQGGTRGQPGDAGYNSQVNQVTGQSPDAFNDEVTMAQENMGTNIVNSETTGGDGGIGPVVTTSSGERTANVATTGGGQADPTQSGFLDDDGNMGENVEIQSNTGGTTDTANPGTGPNDVEQLHKLLMLKPQRLLQEVQIFQRVLVEVIVYRIKLKNQYVIPTIKVMVYFMTV